MMPRRWSSNTRAWAYRYLVLRDGEQCAIGFEIPTTQNTLDIDHIDGDPYNNHPDNLRLLCRRCNVALANKARSTTPNQSPSDQSVYERERGEGKPSTRIVRGAVDYRLAEPTMQANFLFELDFRSWLLRIIQDIGFCSKQDAINAGAEIVGCSPATSGRYLAKLTSSAGPLQERKDMLGDMILTLKEALKPETKIQVHLSSGHWGAE